MILETFKIRINKTSLKFGNYGNPKYKIIASHSLTKLWIFDSSYLSLPSFLSPKVIVRTKRVISEWMSCTLFVNWLNHFMKSSALIKITMRILALDSVAQHTKATCDIMIYEPPSSINRVHKFIRGRDQKVAPPEYSSSSLSLCPFLSDPSIIPSTVTHDNSHNVPGLSPWLNWAPWIRRISFPFFHSQSQPNLRCVTH